MLTYTVQFVRFSRLDIPTTPPITLLFGWPRTVIDDLNIDTLCIVPVIEAATIPAKTLYENAKS